MTPPTRMLRTLHLDHHPAVVENEGGPAQNEAWTIGLAKRPKKESVAMGWLVSNLPRPGTFKRPPFHCACARAGSPAGLPPTPRPPRPGASTCSKRERTDRPTRPTSTVLQSRDVGLKQATRPRSCARMVTATPQRRTIARHGPRWTPSLMGSVQSPRDDRWR